MINVENIFCFGDNHGGSTENKGKNGMAEEKTCPKCGEHYTENKKFYIKCGAAMTDTKVIPPEIDKFNWGAFLLGWIWGVSNKIWLTLIVIPILFIPYIGSAAVLFLHIWFGIKGNEWVWNSKDWKSVEEFNRDQKKTIKFILILLGVFGIIIAIPFIITMIF